MKHVLLRLAGGRAWAGLMAVLVGAICGVSDLQAQSTVPLPLEYKAELLGEFKVNLQSAAGVPLSNTVGVPPGSNGLQPTTAEPSGDIVEPTFLQVPRFSSMVSYGGLAGRNQARWQAAAESPVLQAGITPFNATVAEHMWQPRANATEPGGAIILRRAVIGGTALSRQVSYLFGQVIEPPPVDENGEMLPSSVAASYWLPEPYTTDNHASANYYWSPHSRRVYATQTGPVTITWRKAQPYTEATFPADYTNPNGPSRHNVGGNVFLLYTKNYLVSGSPVKTPRKMYWTEKNFQSTGKPVHVPAARVGTVNIVYNNQFPRTVEKEFKDIGATSPTDGSDNAVPLSELRTLWYDQQQGFIYAYNHEGRVFVELLGDQRSDGQTYFPLGTEIIDVSKRPTPIDVTVELGERIVPPPPGNLEELEPEPLQHLTIGRAFTYRHQTGDGSRIEYWATRETENLNDYLVHWMEAGEAGLRWPKLFGRYKLVWPSDISKYSIYMRPEVASEMEAQQTSVYLDPENAPVIEYQDRLDKERAKFTAELRFYTYLDRTQPAHRTLLRYTSGESIAFERVFSFLVTSLSSGSLANNPVATSLSAWNETTQEFEWPNEVEAPRVVVETVNVGDRIEPPAGEQGGLAGSEYLAGYINQSVGTSFNVGAYVDPFTEGFEAANRGAIIPVNAIPTKNVLEVWWFRPNQARAGLNTGNSQLGFRTHYWPSVVGRYTVQWPTESREIVLASKLGGTGLTTAESQGSIYYQNDPAQPGYNPNEEHAVMIGGVPFATRDDLNITSSPEDYSSAPFVLLDYIDPNDNRPAMSVFRVLREKPEAGWVFDYLVPAGQIIQPPPPLNFLQKPVEGLGDKAVNYNTEPPAASGDLPGGWTSAEQAGPYAHYQGFTYRDRNHNFWVYRGPHGGLVDLEAGTYNEITGQFESLPNARAVEETPFSYTVHVSRQYEYLTLQVTEAPEWLQVIGLTLQGTPPQGSAGIHDLAITVRDLYEGDTVTLTLHLEVVATGTPISQGPLTLVSHNPYTNTSVTFTTRPPFLAASPTETNSFTLRYYYKTEPSFAWPGLTSPPPVGSIVPYLRPLDPETQEYVGDPASKTTESLNIVYRPYWPEQDPKDAAQPLPTLRYGATLTMPKSGLPGVRDFKTARILYQQSIAQDISDPEDVAVSAVLYDPTQAKYVDLTEELPPGVVTVPYQGKYYFPQLPPHLAERLFIDPNQTDIDPTRVKPQSDNNNSSEGDEESNKNVFGRLVLIGQYKQEMLGDNYLMLNVLRGADLQAVYDLCPAEDTAIRQSWVNLVNKLVAQVVPFKENPAAPGTYIPESDETKKKEVGLGELIEIDDDNIPVDSYALSATGPGGGYITLVEAGGTAFTQPGDPVTLHIFKVGGDRLEPGELKVIPSANPLSELLTLQHSLDLAGRSDEYEYEWKIAAPVDGFPPVVDASMSNYQALIDITPDYPRHTLGGAGIHALSDNYLLMRYRPLNKKHPLYKEANADRSNLTDEDWSPWTAPALAEGWIKRVLAGINPFNQRVTDLFNNRVNTDASILTQAGRRWEGDVALNIDTINNYGLIEIYETVLRRGRMLSIEAGYNYGPANDALLLAAGYLNDLYMMLGNEAWADAANPTIGIGTADNNLGDIATAQFAFRGQVASLLEEELALLRGRDDFMLPGVQISPVYNRLIWNYTRGIDAGEVIYALNYNIQENPDKEPDGVINAEDAARLYPQGHGDAYGHYLTALKGYYSLLLNQNFDWVPRIEAVNVLNQPVSVDYQDERKFAAAAAAVARAGRQVFDLTWRKDYAKVKNQGWEHFATTRVNTQRSYQVNGEARNTERFWGMDHWASRVGQGTYLNWVVGNALLPHEDPIPTHEGIQKIDRTTVPELRELVVLGNGIQTALQNAEGGLTPLGLPEDGLVFDINPNTVVSSPEGSHFEQIYNRALQALNNAVASFDDAKDVTKLMRSEQNSLEEFQNMVAKQELAYEVSLIDIYGTPYPEDIGPGKLYPQGYQGPDYLHYAYVDLPEIEFREVWNYSEDTNFTIKIHDLPGDWAENNYTTLNYSGFGNLKEFFESEEIVREAVREWYFPDKDEISWEDIDPDGSRANESVWYFLPLFRRVQTVPYNLGPHGYAQKPDNYTGKRVSPGKIQQAISEVILAHARLRRALFDAQGDMIGFQKSLKMFEDDVTTYNTIRDMKLGMNLLDETLEKTKFAFDLWDKYWDSFKSDIVFAANTSSEAIPGSFIAGLAAGGDLTSVARSAVEMMGYSIVSSLDKAALARYTIVNALEQAINTIKRQTEFFGINAEERTAEVRKSIAELGDELSKAQAHLWTVNERLREYDDKQRAVRALIAQGDTIQKEREIFRRRAAAILQGYRTRDAAFRIFRNEKLERYKTLFDLAARYSLLAANAYDYETGLLDTPSGRSFVQRLMSSRALGIVRNGKPQYAGSNMGDPGLSSILAEMRADWDVLRGRLGINNPDAYGTTVSLRSERYRILPGAEGDNAWRDRLHMARVANILDDADVRRYCLQPGDPDGLAVPGLIITFNTTITPGYNLFGQPLAAGDHAFSPSSFATKLFGVGVAFEGYRGMASPSTNEGAVQGAGSQSAPEPGAWFLDDSALAATPYVYLIPVGADSMRTPPLGDASTVRTWLVQDLAIPLPFNIGNSEFSEWNLFQTSDFLTEPMFAIRKHQAFRPVDSSSLFQSNVFNASGGLVRSSYTNNRLIGRSVWNSQWKLIIPGNTLLNNADEGLERFIRTVSDIRLHFVTYSYSGN